MFVDSKTFWIFAGVTPVVLLVLGYLTSLVISSLTHAKNIPASAADSDSEAVNSITRIASVSGYVFGVMWGLYIACLLSYFGVDLLKDKGGNQQSSSVSSTAGGGNPSGLAKASVPAPTGAEYEKASGKVKSLSARPTDFRMQIQFKDFTGKEQHIDGGEVVEFTIPANATDVKIRWWKGAEVTDFTTATVK